MNGSSHSNVRNETVSHWAVCASFRWSLALNNREVEDTWDSAVFQIGIGWKNRWPSTKNWLVHIFHLKLFENQQTVIRNLLEGTAANRRRSSLDKFRKAGNSCIFAAPTRPQMDSEQKSFSWYLRIRRYIQAKVLRRLPNHLLPEVFINAHAIRHTPLCHMRNAAVLSRRSSFLKKICAIGLLDFVVFSCNSAWPIPPPHQINLKILADTNSPVTLYD